MSKPVAAGQSNSKSDHRFAPKCKGNKYTNYCGPPWANNHRPMCPEGYHSWGPVTLELNRSVHIISEIPTAKPAKTGLLDTDFIFDVSAKLHFLATNLARRGQP